MVRQVICQYSSPALREGQLDRFRRLAREADSNLEFITLEKAVEEQSLDVRSAVDLLTMADFIGLNAIVNPYAVLWQPNSRSANWFERLVREGYEGKRVLIYPSYKEFSAFKRFMGSATNSFEGTDSRLTQKIFNVLKETLH